MKRLLMLIALVTIAVLIKVPIVHAHELQTDANIGAVLHIEPDDDPVVGTPQSFDLFFQDLTNHFTFSQCICSLRLVQNGQIVYSVSPHATGTTTSQNPYTFTKPGLYSVVVSGSPKQPGDFQTFKLTYPIRTEKAVYTAQHPLSPSLIAGFVLLQFLIILAAYTYLRP